MDQVAVQEWINKTVELSLITAVTEVTITMNIRKLKGKCKETQGDKLYCGISKDTMTEAFLRKVTTSLRKEKS